MRTLLHATLLLILITPAYAGVISIVIDDLGYSQTLGDQAINLPAEVTLSVLPNTPYADKLIARASQNGHEVMLHLPMQAMQFAPQEPNTLTLEMSEQELKQTISGLLQRYPEIAGVNNHMGSQVTSSHKTMNWIMQALSNTPSLFFLDSRTTKHSVAESIAAQYFIPNTRRDVFLDNNPNSYEDIASQLDRLATQANKNGFALAIGHPNAYTLEVLRAELPGLLASGLELVPVSEYIKRKDLHQQAGINSTKINALTDL